MSETFTGKVWVLGDDIDTDIIIPTEYLALKTVQDMTPYAFSRLLQRAGSGDYQGTGHPLRDCQILCPDLLPQFHQQRASAH